MSADAIVLDFHGYDFVPFNDLSYRWICVKRFNCARAGVSDRELLDALIHNSRYRDTYLAPDSHNVDSESIHGPYLVDEIDSRSFRAVSQDDATTLVDEFCNLDEHPPTPSVQKDVQSKVLFQLAQASSWYRLPHLPNAEHEFASTLWEFRELVAVYHDAPQIVLVVMAID